MTSLNDAIPGDPEAHVWDVVVIGAGAGGATAGYNLARLGRSVLFLERGKFLNADPVVTRGRPLSHHTDPVDALTHGWWPSPVYRVRGELQKPASPMVGCGTGGSTALFSAVMDRFRPQDFTPRQYFPAVAEAALPEAWPITYEDLEPFYAQAERLFRVRGTADPLMPADGSLMKPPPLSDGEGAIFDVLRSAGLHPYRIHYAMENVPGCTTCALVLCPRECRNDAGRMCLIPAVQKYGAKVLPECRVTRLTEARRSVQQAVCMWRGRELAIRARVFVLAANAYASPAILQRSADENFPSGLANSSGLVGRNLMLHVSDFCLVELRGTSVEPKLNHGISLNDFYALPGAKLGTIQAHSVTLDRTTMEAVLRVFVRSMNRVPSLLVRLLAALAARRYSKSTVFATVVEDLPYPTNRVFVNSAAKDDLLFEYHYPDELRERASMMLDAFRNSVASRCQVRTFGPGGSLNMSHACGTCRFGDDPSTSVLDRDNRAHDLDNLYILDSSFFPSSGGMNPSLTIVANSLRASEKIARRL